MDKIKNQLAGVAALLGVIAAIGGGFVKYGEIITKLDALEATSGGVDHSAQIAVLEEKIAKIEEEMQGATNHGHTKILVNEKQIELINNQIEELKLKNSNPLAQ